MQVIAINKGYYGGQVREPGAQFSLADKKHFSKRWMVKAGTPEGKKFVSDLDRQGRTPIDKVTGEQVLSGGMAAEIALLTEQLAEARREIAVMQKALSERPPSEGPVEDTSVPQADEEEETEVEAAPRQRRRRSAA